MKQNVPYQILRIRNNQQKLSKMLLKISVNRNFSFNGLK